MAGPVFSLRELSSGLKDRFSLLKTRLLLIDRVEITSDRGSRSQMFFKTGDLTIV